MAVSTIDLDHVAVATESMSQAWPRYAGDLGGRWVGGGDTAGFASAQVEFANGMRVEALEPHRADENDFLRRFLDHSGPGPHHVTFKVPDIRAVLDDLTAAGFPPINIDLSSPWWMEGFVHPKQSCGIVVQVAQSEVDPAESGFELAPEPADFPRPRVATARLDRLVHLVADPAAATALFAGVLGGTTVEEGGGWFELAWPGPGRIRFVAPDPGTAEAAWIDGRPGRLHRIEFTVDDPAGVRGAVALDDGRYEVPPGANLGTRLLLSPTA